MAPTDCLDADDCLAQIIFHELCHALTQGEAQFDQPDWGLDNDDTHAAFVGDLTREWACLRVQAMFLRPYGLRKLLAPTTDFRAFYDALPRLPLEQAPARERELAGQALSLAYGPPYRRVLHEALRATAEFHQTLAALSESQNASVGPARGPLLGKAADATPVSGSDRDRANNAGDSPQPVEGKASEALPVLWLAAPAPHLHKSGLPMSDGMFAAPRGATCWDCAYLFTPTKPTAAYRCERSSQNGNAGRVIKPDLAACGLFEPPLDCQTCAACCRKAYSLVPVRPSDELQVKYPQLVARSGKELTVLRDENRQCCAALEGDVADGFRCGVYGCRPRTCRDFGAGTANCVEARRRVGLL